MAVGYFLHCNVNIRKVSRTHTPETKDQSSSIHRKNGQVVKDTSAFAPVCLSWPMRYPIDLVFHVDPRHLHYRLYQDCLQHLRANLSSGSREWLKKLPRAFEILTLCLADRYFPQPQGSSSLYRVSPTAVLDFIIVGMAFQAHGLLRGMDDTARYQLAFLDLIALCWIGEFDGPERGQRRPMYDLSAISGLSPLRGPAQSKSRKNEVQMFQSPHTVTLTWATLGIPVEGRHYEIESADPHYKLYEDCLQHLQTQYSVSSMSECGNHALELWVPQWPACFGTLVNCLVDRDCPPWREQNSESRELLLEDTVVDFLLDGIHSAVALMSQHNRENASCWHVWCVVQRQSGGSLEPTLLLQAFFLGVIKELWLREGFERSYSSKWSIMPWSSQNESLEPELPVLPILDTLTLSDLPIFYEGDYASPSLRAFRTKYGCPTDVPWPMDSHHDGYPFCTTLSSYVQIRRNAQNPTIPEDAALWLSALTFGLLEAFMGIKIPEACLLSQVEDNENSRVFSGASVSRLLLSWYLCHCMPSNNTSGDTRSVPRGHEVIGLLERALLSIEEEGPKLFKRAGFTEEAYEDILSPLALNVVILCKLAASIWDSSLPERTAALLAQLDGNRSAIHNTTMWGQKKLVERGWCPYTISLNVCLSLQTHNLSHFLRLQPPSESPDKHRKCTEDYCTYYTISDPASYEPRHLSSCSCAAKVAFVLPPLSQIEELLSKATIPVIVYNPVKDRLMVQSSSDVPFVAISHVWADGMGSTAEGGLPRCQVARLAMLARQLLPASGAFWIDSLCIPGRKDLRKKAIKLMARTYREAANVLVIDATIQSLCSQSTSWEELSYRISISGWARRLWTLQEGYFAQKLYFEFADNRLVDSKFFEDHIESDGGYFYWHYFPLFTYRAQAGRGELENTTHKVNDMILCLRFRTTSKAEDETIAICSLFPAVDVNTLLNISGDNIAARRMASFLLQLKAIPRRWPLLSPPEKLNLPNFGWAPRSLGEVKEALNVDYAGAGVCTEDGLLAEYAIGRLQTPINIPPECIDGSKKFFRVKVAHDTDQVDGDLPIYVVQFSTPRPEPTCVDRVYTIDSLIFTDVEDLSADKLNRYVLCAGVSELHPPQEGGTEGQVRHCKYVVPGIANFEAIIRDGAVGSYESKMPTSIMSQIENMHVLLT